MQIPEQVSCAQCAELRKDKGVLKKAVLTLKQEKQQYEQQIQELTNTLLQQKNEIMERDEEIAKLKCQETLSKSPSQKSLNSSTQSAFFSVFQQNGSNKKANNEPLKQEIDSLTTQIKQLLEEKNMIIRDHALQNEAVKGKLLHQEQIINNKTKQMDQMVDEYKIGQLENRKLTLQIQSLQDQLDQKDSDNLFLKKQMADILAQQDELKKIIDQKTQFITQQQEALDKSLSNTLISTKQIQDIQQQATIYKVTRVAILPTDVLIILRWNVSDDAVIEIEGPNDRNVYLAREVTDLIPNKEKQDQFQLVFGKRLTETFRTPDTRNLCKQIKQFFFLDKFQKILIKSR